MKTDDSDEYEYSCSDCGGVITAEAETCPHCGADTCSLVEPSGFAVLEQRANKLHQSEKGLSGKAESGKYARPFWQRALKNILISALIFDIIFAVFFVLNLATTNPAPGMGGRVIRGLIGFTIWAAVVGFGCTGYEKLHLLKVSILLLFMGIVCWIIISKVAIPASGIQFADQESKNVLIAFGVVFCVFICFCGQLVSLVKTETKE